jgi:hypothetical protein
MAPLTPRRRTDREPHGIVIHHGGAAVRTVAVWAFLWSADIESDVGLWHDRVPVERNARPVDGPMAPAAGLPVPPSGRP